MSVVVHGFAEGEASGRLLAMALGAPFGLVRTHEFPDGEILPTIPEPAGTVIVHRSLNRPNAKLIELILAAEAWRRLGVRRLVLAAPYLAYMRQDKAFEPGQAVSQKAMAGLLSGCFDRLVTVNAHLHRTAALADLYPTIPAESLSAAGAIAAWLTSAGWMGSDAALVGPDAESLPLVQAVGERLGAHWHVFVKVRRDDRSVDLMLETPDGLRGRRVVILDDICSTGGTLIATIQRARAEGAADVRVVVVHALFGEQTQARLIQAGATKVVSTDSVAHPTNAIGLADLLAGSLISEVTA